MKPFLIASLICVLASPAFADGARQKSDILLPEDNKQWYDRWGYAPALKTEDGTIYVSGVISFLEGEGNYEERYAHVFKRAIERIGKLLELGGASLDDVVEITTFHTDIARQIEAAAMARREVMADPHPSWTAVGTTGLAVPNGQTEIKVIAKVSS